MYSVLGSVWAGPHHGGLPRNVLTLSKTFPMTQGPSTRPHLLQIHYFLPDLLLGDKSYFHTCTLRSNHMHTSVPGCQCRQSCPRSYSLSVCSTVCLACLKVSSSSPGIQPWSLGNHFCLQFAIFSGYICSGIRLKAQIP